MKVLLVGPFETRGRYRGGIAHIVNELFQRRSLFFDNGLDIEEFDTCRVERKMTDQGKMSIGNIKNTYMILHSLRNVVMNSKPDVIYYNTSFGLPLLKDLLVLKLSSSKRNSRVVMHIHFADVDKILPSNKLLAKITFRLLKNETDHIVFLSKKTCSSFIEKGIKEEKTSVIYNFHNIKMERIEVEKKIEELPVKEKREILFIGSIDERKGILDLLAALTKVSFPFHLSICGNTVDSETERKLEEAIKTLPIGSVDIMGFVGGEAKENVLKQSDILILPSYAEGFPIVLLEGISAACAIISTDVGAIPEVFCEKNGAVLRPGDTNGIAKAIEGLNDNKRLGSIMKYNYEISQEYSIEQFIEKMSGVCKKVVL